MQSIANNVSVQDLVEAMIYSYQTNQTNITKKLVLMVILGVLTKMKNIVNIISNNILDSPEVVKILSF
jgi:hypothetical protein